MPRRARTSPRGQIVLGVLGLGGLALGMLGGCAAGTRPLGDPDRFAEGQCRARYVLDHEDSPLTELRELGGARDDFQERFPAAEIDPKAQRPVSATAGIRLDGRAVAWFSPALDVVVFDAVAFAPLRQADPTRATPEPSQRVGRVTPRAREALGDRTVVELLLRAGVIQTYWHLGADLCLDAETSSEGKYRARLHGVHHYVTDRDHEQALAFEVRIDADDEITVTPRSTSP